MCSLRRSRLLFLQLCVTFATYESAVATDGFDISDSASVVSFRCMYNKGYRFFTAHLVHTGNGHADIRGVKNVAAALQAGFHDISGYLYACTNGTSSRKCPSANDQVKSVVDALNGHSVSVKTLYVDVEQPYSKRYPWPRNQTQNQIFIQDMVDAIAAHGIQAGIYTSASGWYPVVGHDWTNVSDLPLFWTTGRKKDFSEFKPFGGWVRPTIHQYALDVREYMKGCVMPLVDKDWKPCDPINTLGSAASKPEDPLHTCSKGWTQLNVTGNCYAVTDDFASWSEGHAHCQRLGAELVSIHSDVETRALSEFVLVNQNMSPTSLKYLSIGSFKNVTTGQWQWTDGTESDYNRAFIFCGNDTNVTYALYVGSNGPVQPSGVWLRTKESFGICMMRPKDGKTQAFCECK